MTTIRSTYVLLVAGMLLLVPNGSHAESKAEKTKKAKLEADVKAAISAYVNCAYASGDAHTRSSGTAKEIAEAALGDCGGEFSTYDKAAHDFLIASAPRREFRFAIQRADLQVADFKDQVRREVISRVLRARDAGAR